MSDTQVRDDGPRLSQGGDPMTSFAERVLDVLVDRNRRSSVSLRQNLVVALAEGMLHPDDNRIEGPLREFRRACISPAAMAEVYVPAAARLLGREWAEDGLCFADVTIASARLQALVRAIGTRWGGDMTHGPGGPSILMLVPEGEDHTLGAVVATGQLRRMGVSVCLRLGMDHRALSQLLRSRVFDAAMVSVGTNERLDGSRRLVDTLRALGPRGMPVIAGGGTVLDKDALRARSGADFVTCDLGEALAFCGFGAIHPVDGAALLAISEHRT